MIKSLILIIVIGGLSFINTDVKSSSIFYSAILPLVVLASVISLAVWFALLFHKKKVNQNADIRSDGPNTGIDYSDDD